MDSIVIKTKAGIPPIARGTLRRARLDARWEQWRSKKLVLVTAGAGFGKTSFLATGVREDPRPGVWLSLDEQDTSPPRFFAHLLYALHDALGTARGSRRRPESPDEVLAAIVQRLHERKGGGLLVLDDVHLVESSRPVLEFIEKLIRYLPQDSTLILSSRERIGIPVSRLRSIVDCAMLDAEDLAFRIDEIRALFRLRFPGGELEEEAAQRLATLTEGWAAGLEIFLQTVDGAAPDLVAATLTRMQSTGKGWFDYFAEEITARLDPDTQDFLMRSALLPRLEAGLCEEILGDPESGRRLEELSRRNLFVFDAAGNESFRYHHLFRDFLRKRLVRVVDPKVLAGLRLKVARTFRRRGEWVEAVTAYAETEDAEAALGLIDKQGEKLLATGQYSLIRHSLDALPKPLVARHPGALFLLGRIQEIQGLWDEAETTYGKALRIADHSPLRMELMSLIAQLRMRKGDHRACRRYCKRAFDEPGKMASAVKGRLYGLLGVSACDLCDFDEGEKHLREAEKIFRRSQDAVGEGRVLFLLSSNVHSQRGEFRQARSTARRSLAIFRKLEDPRRTCHSLGILGWAMFISGKLREGHELTREALRIAESLNYGTMLGICHDVLARSELMNGDLATAEHHFEQAREIGDRLGEAELQSTPLIGLGEVAFERGNRHLARRLGKQALAIVQSMKDRVLEGRCLELLGQVELKTRPRLTAEHWSEAERLFRKVGANYYLHRLLLMRAAGLRLKDDELRELLRELLAGTARMDHDHLFLDMEPAWAKRVLPRALALGVESDYVADLLTRLGAGVVPELEPLLADDSEAIRMKAVEIVAAIGGREARESLARVAKLRERDRPSRLAAAEVRDHPAEALTIRALGSLRLRRGEREWSHGHWRSDRARRLFQLLLVHRFRWVPSEVLCETLWPEADPRKSKGNLRQSILLLRRMLDPAQDDSTQAGHVQHQSDAYRLNPGEDYEYDVEAFEAAVDEADAHWRAGEHEEAKPCLRRAVDLHGGSFLEESPFEEFVVLEREDLGNRFLRGLQRLIAIDARARRWEEIPALCRRGIALDPYSEELYHALVSAQFELGHRKEAMESWQRYEEMMMREMELLPSEKMKSLAERIIAGRG